MSKDDLIRVRHMLDAARDALSFSEGNSRAGLEANRMLALSIVKSIEIIGEAAAHVSEDGRKTWPGVPWVNIVSMRNRLIHAYYDIDLDRVWDTVSQDIPPLIKVLERIVGEND